MDEVVDAVETPSAAAHSYLGDNLENVYIKMQNFSDDCGVDEFIASILVVQLESTIFFPGESIALRLDKRYVSYIYQEGSFNNSIGVMLQSDGNNYGTTCEIKSRSRQDNDGEILIKGIGRRRFVVNDYLKVTSFGYNKVCIANVTVLTEKYTANSIYSQMSHSWPRWLYDKVVEPPHLAYKALQLFQEIGNFDFNLLERFNPTEFSYFIAANLPLQNQERLSLLQAENVSLRLLSIIEIMKLSAKNLCCATCKLKIAQRDDIFTVDGDINTVGNYVNSHGIVHQTITLKKLVTNVLFTSRPSTADSWFPGTAWTIICCPRCLNHLGWHYKYVQQFTSISRSPFFGLRRVAISVEKDDSEDRSNRMHSSVDVNEIRRAWHQFYYNSQMNEDSGHSESDAEYLEEDVDDDDDEDYEDEDDEDYEDNENDDVEVFSCDDGVGDIDIDEVEVAHATGIGVDIDDEEDSQIDDVEIEVAHAADLDVEVCGEDEDSYYDGVDYAGYDDGGCDDYDCGYDDYDDGGCDDYDCGYDD
jgi:cereblon